jgi:hypothetical protein
MSDGAAPPVRHTPHHFNNIQYLPLFFLNKLMLMLQK